MNLFDQTLQQHDALLMITLLQMHNTHLFQMGDISEAQYDKNRASILESLNSYKLTYDDLVFGSIMVDRFLTAPV